MKNFKEMYNLDISQHVQKKPTFRKEGNKFVKMPEKYWLEYIEWSVCLMLLYENGAQSVRYGSYNKNGYPAIYNDGQNPFVHIWVSIDGEAPFDIYFPVIDGNKVKSSPNQLDIHIAQQRAFVKCVAINTGLGLKLWQKEEKQMQDTVYDDRKELTPDDTEAWDKAEQYIINGGTVDNIKKKYKLSSENEKLLTNL